MVTAQDKALIRRAKELKRHQKPSIDKIVMAKLGISAEEYKASEKEMKKRLLANIIYGDPLNHIIDEDN